MGLIWDRLGPESRSGVLDYGLDFDWTCFHHATPGVASSAQVVLQGSVTFFISMLYAYCLVYRCCVITL